MFSSFAQYFSDFFAICFNVVQCYKPNQVCMFSSPEPKAHKVSL